MAGVFTDQEREEIEAQGRALAQERLAADQARRERAPDIAEAMNRSWTAGQQLQQSTDAAAKAASDAARAKATESVHAAFGSGGARARTAEQWGLSAILDSPTGRSLGFRLSGDDAVLPVGAPGRAAGPSIINRLLDPASLSEAARGGPYGPASASNPWAKAGTYKSGSTPTFAPDYVPEGMGAVPTLGGDDLHGPGARVPRTAPEEGWPEAPGRAGKDAYVFPDTLEPAKPAGPAAGGSDILGRLLGRDDRFDRGGPDVLGAQPGPDQGPSVPPPVPQGSPLEDILRKFGYLPPLDENADPNAVPPDGTDTEGGSIIDRLMGDYGADLDYLRGDPFSSTEEQAMIAREKDRIRRNFDIERQRIMDSAGALNRPIEPLLAEVAQRETLALNDVDQRFTELSAQERHSRLGESRGVLAFLENLERARQAEALAIEMGLDEADRARLMDLMALLGLSPNMGQVGAMSDNLLDYASRLGDSARTQTNQNNLGLSQLMYYMYGGQR